MFNYNQETIYSLLCAVLPCFIYLLVWGRKTSITLGLGDDFCSVLLAGVRHNGCRRAQ